MSLRLSADPIKPCSRKTFHQTTINKYFPSSFKLPKLKKQKLIQTKISSFAPEVSSNKPPSLVPSVNPSDAQDVSHDVLSDVESDDDDKTVDMKMESSDSSSGCVSKPDANPSTSSKSQVVADNQLFAVKRNLSDVPQCGGDTLFHQSTQPKIYGTKDSTDHQSCAPMKSPKEHDSSVNVKDSGYYDGESDEDSEDDSYDYDYEEYLEQQFFNQLKYDFTGDPKYLTADAKYTKRKPADENDK